MRRWVLRVLLAGMLGAGAFWGWRVLFPSPERVIRKNLEGLARTVSIAPNEAPLAKLANSQKVTTYFTRDVEIMIEAPGYRSVVVRGLDELFQGATAVRQQFTSLEVDFLDLNVTLDPDRRSAVSQLTGKIKVPGDKSFVVQEMKFTWRKDGRNWLIRRAETVKTLF